MKTRVLVLVITLLVLTMPSSQGSIIPLGTGVKGAELREELISKGFRCSTLVKSTKFTCTKFNKKLIVETNLVGGNWPSKGIVNSVKVTSIESHGQIWLTKLAQMFFSERADLGSIDTASWVTVACKDEVISDLYEERIWGNNFTISSDGIDCSMRIWSYRF